MEYFWALRKHKSPSSSGVMNLRFVELYFRRYQAIFYGIDILLLYAH
jgi:hypothetical protein